VDSDNQVMLLVKSGMIEKLGILFERHKMALFGYFFKITRNKEASEDLVQNVFLRILKYRTKFSGYGKFAAWMFHIAHNVAVDYFKKNKKFSSIDKTDSQNLAGSENIEEDTLKNENSILLNDAFERLSLTQKEILTLSKYQELKYKDIGEILGCSESAVKVRVFRALTELKSIYLKLEDK